MAKFRLKPSLNKFWFGLVLGILAPIFVLICYYLLQYNYLKADTFLFKIFLSNILSPLLSLCVLVNLGLFFIFIQTESYKPARGIIAATIFYAVFIFILKLAL